MRNLIACSAVSAVLAAIATGIIERHYIVYVPIPVPTEAKASSLEKSCIASLKNEGVVITAYRNLMSSDHAAKSEDVAIAAVTEYQKRLKSKGVPQ